MLDYQERAKISDARLRAELALWVTIRTDYRHTPTGNEAYTVIMLLEYECYLRRWNNPFEFTSTHKGNTP